MYYYDESMYEYECFEVAKKFKECYEKDFNDEVYCNFEKLCSGLEYLKKEQIEKIKNIVSLNQNFRPIDVVVF